MKLIYLKSALKCIRYHELFEKVLVKALFNPSLNKNVVAHNTKF